MTDCKTHNNKQREPSALAENLFTAKDYTDVDIFALEQKTLFSQGWHFVGLSEDLAEVDDYLTVTLGNCHLVVVKTEDGLMAFHNICRHRGMQILEGRGKLPNQLTCPYHDWTYNKQGELKSLPKSNKEFAGLTAKSKKCLSLKPASAAIWRGIIWANPEQNCQTIEQYFLGMENHLAPYQVEELVEASEHRYEQVINANWKLVVENYIDHYHLAQLHSGTLSMYDHQKAEFGFVGQHFHFWEPLSKDYARKIDKNSPYPLLIDKDHQQLGAWVPMLFPCIGLAESESSWSVFQVIPLAVDKTKVIVRSKVKNSSSLQFLSQAWSSYSYWQGKIKSKRRRTTSSSVIEESALHALESADFMQEDIYVCEQVQKSLQSPYFEFGPSAEYGESPIRGFQLRVKQALAK